MSRFAVLVCNSSATFDLYRWGIEKGVPIWIPLARQRRAVGGTVARLSVPALPGYAFCPIEAWHPSLAPPKYWVRPLAYTAAGEPYSCRTRDLFEMQRLLNAEAAGSPKPPAIQFKVGDRVRVSNLHPVFPRAVGTVERLKPDDMIRVQLDTPAFYLDIHKRLLAPTKVFNKNPAPT